FHAFSLTDKKARPGGIMSAFCDPVTQTSTCQSSVRHSMTARPLMASTSRTAEVGATSLPNAAMSWPTPVEVSLSVEQTATASGWAFIACASCSGETAWPQGTVTLIGSTPNALQMLRQRSPKRPAIKQMALLPAGQQLATAASRPPVPELVNGTTGFFV